MTNQQLIAKYSNMPTGVYRELIDSTRQADVPAGIQVVLVGQFSKGPIMNPIYCEDIEVFHAIFGKRDLRLESRGCYSVLQAEHALEQGPIWVLNIKNISAYEETVQSVHVPLATSEYYEKVDASLNEVFDTSNFWKANSQYGTRGIDKAGLTFTSVSNGTVSVIVQKHAYSDYDYTVGETKARHPEFLGAGLSDNHLVSDYMVTVHVFKSDLPLEASKLAGQTCLVSSGDKTLCVTSGKGIHRYNLPELSELIQEPAMKYYKSYDGTIADVIDMSGRNLNIAQQINADTLSSGLACALNVDALMEHGIDLLGTFTEGFDIEKYGAPVHTMSGVDMVNLTLPSRYSGIMKTFGLLPIEGLVKRENGNYAVLQLPGDPTFLGGITDFSDGAPVRVGMQLHSDGKIVRILSTDYTEDVYSLPSNLNTEDYPISPEGLAYPKNGMGVYVYPANHPMAGDTLDFDDGDWLDFWDGLDQPAVYGTYHTSHVRDFNDVTSRSISLAYGTAYRLIDVKLDSNGFDDIATTAVPEIVTTSKNQALGLTTLGNPYMISLSKLSETVSILTDPNLLITEVHTLSGIIDSDQHYVNGTPARQNAVLNKLNTDSIMQSFFDPTVFRCRYMIDSFKTYIEPNAKSQFGQLAAYCKRFPVFTSTPFYYELLTSKNPDFRDILGNFKMSYVVAGRNPDKLSTNSFSMPNNGEQGPWLIPIMPGVYNDGFSDTVIPLTGAVAKLYYRKHSGVHKTYEIVGGKDWPVEARGVVGPEKQYDILTRGQLEKLGANIIQRQDGILQLRSSRTAYQSVTSALNAPETIEKFLHLSDIVEPVIESKHFKYNDVNSRNAVLSIANSACQTMQADGAIADYENICDLSNNTTEVRSRGIIVLDSILYNEFGIRIGVHRTELKLPQQ